MSSRNESAKNSCHAKIALKIKLRRNNGEFALCDGIPFHSSRMNATRQIDFACRRSWWWWWITLFAIHWSTIVHICYALLLHPSGQYTYIHARGWVSFIFIRVHFATSHGTKSIKLIKKGKRELWTESVELFHSGNATRLFVIIFFSFRFALFTDYSGGDAMFHVLGLCANTQYSNWCEPSINFIVCTENNWAKNALFCLFRFALHRIITDASINIMTNNRAEHYCAFPVDFPLQKNGRKNPLHQ